MPKKESESMDLNFDSKLEIRTDIVQKYIPLDTKSLIELFVEKDKNNYLSDIEHTKHNLWNKYFKLDKKKVFKQKDYVFDHRISTDCFSVSIQLIHKDYVVKEQEKKTNMKNKKKEMKEKCKNMDEAEKKKFKHKLEQKKKTEQEEIKLENKKKRVVTSNIISLYFFIYFNTF
jgi:hypothetical protein